MSVKIGDKVRFLNSVGGGIVKSFKGKDSVMVEEEDGFETPVFIRECVVVGEKDTFIKVGSYTGNQKSKAEPEPQPKVQPRPDSYRPEETSGGDSMNIWLAYLLTDPKNINQSDYEVYFVNESNYYLYFSYMNRQNGRYISRYNGMVEPNTKIYLETFKKEVINELERVCVQFIAFKKDKPFTLKNPANVEIRLDTVKFYKIHCFTENDFFEDDALLYPIIRKDVAEKELVISPEELKEAMYQKAQDDRRTSSAPQNKSNAQIIEVDLHAQELLDSTAGLSNADILIFQLDKFHETMKQYAAVKGQKIVVIHGKGNGVLRAAIEKELRTKYKQYTYQDASFREYGFGATLITIK